ncbi:MAG: glycosyltransferase [Cyclobacteriaceae bacterium]|nr:glycosyltransferase [Cyclobacteriaceae bacterium]
MIEICFWIFIVSSAILILYYSLTLLAIGRYRKPEALNINSPGISIIIAAKNEIENLQQLIPTLLKQDYPNFEIILVDDKSTDLTYDFGIGLMQDEKRFRFIRIDTTPDHIHNKKYAITLGIKAAKFDHILLTDADCNPTGNSWIQEMTNGFSDDNKTFVLGFSQYKKEPGFLNRFIRFETLLTAHSYFGLGLLGKPYMGVGRNLAYRKTFFLSKNGFGKHQGIIGGDDDLFVNSHANRRNTGFVISPESIMTSHPKNTLGEFMRQKMRHLSTGKYYKLSDRLILGLIAITRVIFWISLFCAIFAIDKLLFVGIGFILTIVSLMFSLQVLIKKTGDEDSVWSMPYLDFTYIFYYISIGLKVLFTKKIKWN